MPKSEDDGMARLRNAPFSVLVKNDSDLASIRREYASMSAKRRRMAADWEYHSQMASEMVEKAIAMTGEEGLGKPFWPAGVAALAIDPQFAPAILTVSSIEYQLDRVEEAMKLTMRLVTLPEDTEDLSIIIDKAGDFLIEQGDYENALGLYSAAEKAYPQEAVYPNGSGYCLGKLERREESVEKYRRADALEPDSYIHLNDLGYSLFEAGEFDEAEEILQRSISLAPEDYELARNNLSRLKETKAES